MGNRVSNAGRRGHAFPNELRNHMVPTSRNFRLSRIKMTISRVTISREKTLFSWIEMLPSSIHFPNPLTFEKQKPQTLLNYIPLICKAFPQPLVVCGYAVQIKAYVPTSSLLVLLSVEKQGEEITTGNCVLGAMCYKSPFIPTREHSCGSRSVALTERRRSDLNSIFGLGL